MNERGAVVRVRLDPTEGQEQAGTRPAVILSASLINDYSNVVIVAPVTSRKTDRVFPFEAMLDHEQCGLNTPSKVMLNQLRGVSKQRILGVYGRVDAAIMTAIDSALRIALDI